MASRKEARPRAKKSQPVRSRPRSKPRERLLPRLIAMTIFVSWVGGIGVSLSTEDDVHGAESREEHFNRCITYYSGADGRFCYKTQNF